MRFELFIMADSDEIKPLPGREAAEATVEESPTVEKEVVKDETRVEGEGEMAPSSDSKEKEGEGLTPSETPTDTDAPTEAPSFREESYNVGDLKESEKKALEALRLKIEEEVRNKAFFEKAKSESKRELRISSKRGEEGGGSSSEELDKVVKEGEISEESVAGAGASSANATLAARELGMESIEEQGGEMGDVSEEKAFGEKTVKEETVANVDDHVQHPSPQKFFLWGIPIHHEEGEDERRDVILLKFLRARDFKTDEAFNMLRNVVTWRRDFMADKLLNEDLGDEFDSLAFMHGRDKEGHPVCYNQYGAFQDTDLYQQIFGDEKKFDKFLRWRIQVLEKGIRELDFMPGGVNSMVQIIDLKNSPGFLKRRQITKKALSLLQDNYPELVARQIVLNIPWYFPAMYAVFGRLFTARQERKVVLARPGKSTETLFRYIAPQQVPIKYGGLSRPGDTEFQGKDAPVTQVPVKAGDKLAIELPITQPESRLVWDVSVVGWDVIYGEEFIPSDEKAYTMIIRKATKVATTSDPIRNSFKCTQSGKVVLTIDNSASKKKKIVVYRSITQSYY